MKYLAALMVCLMLIFSALSIVSSDSTPIVQLEYGDRTSGVLNDEFFEWIYEFEGEADDTIMLEFFVQQSGQIASPSRFFLIREQDRRSYQQNMVITDFDGRTSGQGLLMQLDGSGTYYIVVERNERRWGRGSARFELSLDLVATDQLESSWRGNLALNPTNTSHYFFVDQPGTYRILMGQPGLVNPGFRIEAVMPGTPNFSAVVEFNIATINRVSFDVNLVGDTLYVVRLFPPRNNPFINLQNSATYPYNIRITPVDEREPR
jgi:hypothetical protein